MLALFSQGKLGKSAGGDEISLDLLRALAEIPEGREQLLA